ncbi:MAG: hypothetical protein WA837_07540, partial [Xanthobacteraceae bacterium]
QILPDFVCKLLLRRVFVVESGHIRSPCARILALAPGLVTRSRCRSFAHDVHHYKRGEVVEGSNQTGKKLPDPLKVNGNILALRNHSRY